MVRTKLQSDYGMVRTMSTGLLRHREVREAIAARIVSGELGAGDRLPSERALQEEFSCARSVVRQALAALTRDGWIVSSNQRGYAVLGPRIPWISRLRLLSDEPWTLTIANVRQDVASADVAEALEIPVGAVVVARDSYMTADASAERWGGGSSYYPADGLRSDQLDAMLTPGELTYDAIESVYGRRIIGYRETIRARTPSAAEAKAFVVTSHDPLVEVRRTSRTTSTPVSTFTFVGRSDRFEVDYIIQA
jgi:GntR family transcriptional regulator